MNASKHKYKLNHQIYDPRIRTESNANWKLYIFDVAGFSKKFLKPKHDQFIKQKTKLFEVNNIRMSWNIFSGGVSNKIWKYLTLFVRYKSGKYYYTLNMTASKHKYKLNHRIYDSRIRTESNVNWKLW